MEDADRDEEEIAETPAVRGAETPTVRGQFLVDGITLEEKKMQQTSSCCVRFEIDPSKNRLLTSNWRSTGCIGRGGYS